MAMAILDLLLHHSHVVTIRGDSYRLREKRHSKLSKAGSTIAPRRCRHGIGTSDQRLGDLQPHVAFALGGEAGAKLAER
jgi:hypothetical protein